MSRALQPTKLLCKKYMLKNQFHVSMFPTTSSNDLHLQGSFGEVAEQNDGRNEGAGISRLGGDDGCG